MNDKYLIWNVFDNKASSILKVKTKMDVMFMMFDSEVEYPLIKKLFV